jgi:predicted MFS family arabinose efflux permease
VSAASPVSSDAKRAALLVAFMWVAYFLNYCDRQAVFSMTGSLKTDLKMTDTQLGLVGAIFLWVYAFGCPIAGQIGDRLSKRLLVVLSLVIWSLVTVATGFAGTAMMMLGLRAAMGISESLFMPTAVALTANAHTPDRRSRAIAALTTAQIAGTVVGSWFGGWMADRGAWRAAFFILGAVGVLYAIPYFLFLRTVDENPAEIVKTSGRSLAVSVLTKIPTFLLLCLVFPVFVFGLWLLYGWLPTFLREKFELTQADAAFNATVYLQATTAVGLLGGGMLADALYRRTKASRLWLMTASLILCAPCLHYLGSSDTLLATRLAAAGFGLFSGLLMGNIFPAAFEVVPADTRASAVGILNFFGAIMSGFAALFGGMWKASLGIDRLLSITALAYVAAGLALVFGIKVLFPRDHENISASS